jgi:hypothetical protein
VFARLPHSWRVGTSSRTILLIGLTAFLGEGFSFTIEIERQSNDSLSPLRNRRYAASSPTCEMEGARNQGPRRTVGKPPKGWRCGLLAFSQARVILFA